MNPSLLAALIAVESGGRDHVVGDGGRAIGPLQIHRAVVDDVNARYGTHYRWQGMTNRADAIRVASLYLGMYAKGKPALEAARIWNGGPAACRPDRRHLTDAYVAKVRRHLN